MCYIFCPFSQIGSALQKISTDVTEAIVIALIWPTQHWFPQLLQMVCKQSYILPNIPNLLTLPNEPQRNHPLKKMRLGAFRVSGNPLKVEAYQKTLKPFYCLHGENPLKNNIGHILRNGCHFVIKEINIFEANVDSVLTYLTELYNAGLGYSCINTARSALSSFLQLENCVSVGSHPLVRRFMKGVFNLRPSLPRYNVT